MSSAVIARIGGLQLREAAGEDVPFIIDSWCKSYQDGALAALGPIDADKLKADAKSAFCAANIERVRALIAAPTTKGAVLADDATPDTLQGHVVYEVLPAKRVRVHYVYIVGDLRKAGAARWVLKSIGASNGGEYTHHTLKGARLAEHFGLMYRPATPTQRRTDDTRTQVNSPQVTRGSHPGRSGPSFLHVR